MIVDAALESGELGLHKGAKYLVNPGAVGQPRDGDPRACYAIADTEARRVELIRLDGLQRANADVGMGDHVDVNRAEVKPAPQARQKELPAAAA